MPISLTRQARLRIKELLEAIDSQRVPYRNFVASWSNSFGTLSVGKHGLDTISEIADELRNVSSLATFPKDYLTSEIAREYLKHPSQPLVTLAALLETLTQGYSRQQAFVPIWGFEITDDFSLRFGEHVLIKLGEDGFKKQILDPFESFRSAVGPVEFAKELAHIKKSYEHISAVPVLIVTYMGSARGAKDVVDPIATRVSEIMQFLVAWKTVRDRAPVIHHSGAYFGRFMSIMPVLSRDSDMQPFALNSPNIRGFPYGATLNADDVKFFTEAGFLGVLPQVLSNPSRGHGAFSLLLRAIQLFSDGERAISSRQALISYVGACDVLFGKKDAAELYTCAGMAAAAMTPFLETFKRCKRLYGARSDAAHLGVTPTGVEDARYFSMNSIRYVSVNRSELSNKRKIRDWLAPYVDQVRASLRTADVV